jgi:PucR C-terminal helix-turn-helix domain/GGDEF-like domain
MSDPQALVDALAGDLDRPVGVDDRRFRSIAYSSHDEGVDQVRVASILHREAPRPVTEWLESLGVREADPYLRVPANGELGMAARICIPLRFDGILLGFLWLIDEPEPVPDPKLAAAVGYAEEISAALYRARLLERESREHEGELLATLLGLRPGDAAAAAEALVREGLLATAALYSAFVLHATRQPREDPTAAVRLHLADAAAQVRRTVAPGHLLVLERGDEVAAILAAASEEELSRRGAAIAEAVTVALAGEPGGWLPLVAVGAPRDTVPGIAASHAEARQAIRVGEALGLPGPLVEWQELGAYRTLADLLGSHDADPPLPASLRRLLESRDAATLLPTLETYLDLAGDARAAAGELYVHRSSLYGRIHRIEEIAGVDLSSGEDRLELHLGLRLWRLSGGRLPD